MEYTTELQEKLIDLVEKRSTIWDPRYKNHVNRDDLDICWREIGRTIGLSGKEASKMWKSLRHEFKRQYSQEKAKAANGASPEQFESTWPLFTKLLFLKEKGRHQKAEPVTRESVIRLVSNSMVSVKEEPLEHDEATTFLSSDVNAMPPFKKLKTLNADVTLTVAKTEKFNKNVKRDYDVDDEDIGFFNSLLPHVRRLSLSRKFIFRMETQKLVYDLTFAPSFLEERQEQSQQPG
ncbi:transcription factor Adf-1-like [Ceratina calcarata]|uniref:Transcription factor Adf-1-like n=1 Tax=Ceratina calcarata TaxID=156304 RepID=A0AAJ7S7B3_9HYME|nr:transcription factor Adf-1-like [Ceratina calcarata]XP_026671944.1 transcription factor Adf-1-like [Ceratina calcarata]